jgi:flagellar hook-associated protein 3 FlgL
VNGLPNNIYNLLGEIATALENNDLTNITAYSDKLGEASDNMIVKYGEIGAQSKFLSFITDRLTASETNSKTRQTELEGIDTAEAALEYNQQATVYDASLAMGAKITQQTLFDYI